VTFSSYRLWRPSEKNLCEKGDGIILSAKSVGQTREKDGAHEKKEIES
jgi:hypothetical protein